MLLKKTLKLLKQTLIVLLIVLISSWLTTAPSHVPKSNDSIKGVWLTHLGTSLLNYTTIIDNVFHQLSCLDFNQVYISVYNDGTLYPSKIAPKNYLVSLPFTDPFRSAIKQGKRQGLKIYGWYEYGMMLNQRDQLAQKHPDWILSTSNGKKLINHHLWLDPENNEVEQYFINLFTEVAQKYPELYGIQLDDHWGIPQEFGNKTLAMTKLTSSVFQAVKKANPKLIISLSPNPYNFANKFYNQDWLTWVKQQLIDEIVLQIYRPTAQAVEISLANSGLKTVSQSILVGVGIYTGHPFSPKSLTEIAQQIAVVTKYNYGYVLFCWEYLFTPLHHSSSKQREAVLK